MSAHQVLYQRFRPASFADLVGQAGAVEPLKHWLVKDEVPHALLFSGLHGTGKTTAARLVAASLNCTQRGSSPEPCGRCPSCQGVMSGSAGLSVIEVDCATNRSIDAIRSLQETMSVSTTARYRVVILDEVHRLTPDATVALLKTVEEPSAGVKLILATTDPHKVLKTLRSRCVKITFRPIERSALMALAHKVAKEADLDVDEAGLSSVVDTGHGSARDMLSALELVAAGAAPEAVSPVTALAAAVEAASVPVMMVAVARAVAAGVAADVLAADVLAHWHTCLLAVEAPETLDMDEVALKEAARQGQVLGTRRLVVLLRAMSDAVGRMGAAGDPRLLLEATLLSATTASASSDVSALHDRLDDVQDEQDAQRAHLERVVALLEASAAKEGWPPALAPAPASPEGRAREVAPVVVHDEPGRDAETTSVTGPEAGEVHRDPEASQSFDEPGDDEWEDDEPEDDQNEQESAPASDSEPRALVDDTRTAVGIFADVEPLASRRLGLHLGGMDVRFAPGGRECLEVTMDESTPEAMRAEVRSLLADQGYRTDFYDFDNDDQEEHR